MAEISHSLVTSLTPPLPAALLQVVLTGQTAMSFRGLTSRFVVSSASSERAAPSGSQSCCTVVRREGARTVTSLSASPPPSPSGVRDSAAHVTNNVETVHRMESFEMINEPSGGDAVRRRVASFHAGNPLGCEEGTIQSC